MDDGSGWVLVEGAEILTTHKHVSFQGGYRNTEWILIEGDSLYIIGEHVTLGGSNAMLDKRADLGEMLAEWKRDKHALLACFDADRDGQINEAEWEQARKAATDAVDREHLEIRLQDGVHLMRKPAHSRPFLITNREATALTRHFRLWSWWHLLSITGALTGLGLVV